MVGVELIFWGEVFVQMGSGVGSVVLCCVVLCVSFVFGFC